MTLCGNERRCYPEAVVDAGSNPLLAIDDLVVGFPAGAGWTRVVDRVSLAVQPGERVGLVGGSGSGKSLTALAALALVPAPGRVLSGRVRVAGVDPVTAPAAELRRLRGGVVALVLQEPAEALNPVLSVGFQLVEAIRSHRPLDRRAARAEACRLLSAVSLDPPEPLLPAYPHQLSGGQAQRVMLALALAGEPRLLIADEPTTALDLCTQAEVLDLLRGLCFERRLALLLIGHDLAVVASLVERVVVMLAGEVVETGPTGELFARPLHPYTRLLVAARAGGRETTEAAPPADRWPHLATDRPGCRFAPVCPLALPACREQHPELEPAGRARLLRCPVVDRPASCDGGPPGPGGGAES
jgi:oligopeptide/dipeptide ABC transporter ATP-binding protein